MTALLEVEDLHVWFDLPHGRELHAVQGVSFSVDRGERLGLVGESGSGKTTAILALMGLLPPTASAAGTVLLDGENVLERGERTVAPHRWRDVSMVFQGAMNAFNPVKRIGDQLIEPMELHGIASGDQARRRAGELLERVGIAAARAKSYPHEFSGGMRQRAAIAMALACEPKLLLADEPTTALDVMVQAQILQLLVALADDLGLALVLVTHDLPVVAQTCTSAAVTYAGEIVETGPMDTLYHAPRHPYTRLLFAATPDLESRDVVISIPGMPPRLDEEIVGCPFRERCDRAFEPCLSRHPTLQRVEGRHEAACHLLNAVTASSSTSGAGPLLEVDGLVVRYPVARGLTGALLRHPKQHVHAVSGVSFTVSRGEMVALVGESGCGKTTTAQALLRLVRPEAGSVRFDGIDVTSLGARELRRLRRRMQIIYQDPYESLDPRFRVETTVAEPLVVHREGTRAERRERMIQALELAGLSPPELYLDRYPHELSGGQRQRVAIAASLALGPDLLVADEPVSMLDVSVRAGILTLLDGLRDSGLAVLMITHDLSTAARFADRICVMYLGRIVEEGPAVQVIEEPRHPYTKALLSVVPRRDPRRRVRPEILRGETPNPIDVPSGCRFHPRCPVAIAECQTTDPELRGPVGGGAAAHRAACILVDR